MKTVMLNAGKINFDHRLDLSPISDLTDLTIYETSSVEEIAARVQDQEIVITKELPVGADLIAAFPAGVKLICEAGTGYNNIDLKKARERNILVTNVPGYSTESVAQLAITLILSLSSSLPQQQVMLKQGNFANFTQHLMVPHFEVQHKILGVIGAGAIGQKVIKIARVLGMEVLAFNRSARTWDDSGIKSVSLEELLSTSDFVSIHCPLTPETKHLINRERLRMMKPSAFIINTSRGAIIKEPDLIAALQNQEIAGAALDVQDPEPPSTDNPLFHMDNVILTPHIGWKTIESRQRLIDLLALNIKAFLEGEPLNVVN